MSDVKMLQGDCREVLKTLASQSVHCVITSPPYWGLRDYGTEPQVWPNGSEPCEAHEWVDGIKPGNTWGTPNSHSEAHTGSNKVGANVGVVAATRYATCARCGAWRGSLGLEPTPELYVAHLVQIFREVRRVLRGDGTLWLNLGDSYVGGKGANNHRWSAEHPDRETLEQPHHHLMIATGRPHDNMETMRQSGLKAKDLCGIPWMVAFALRADGWYLRSDIIWSKPNPMPESVTDRPTKAHEYVFLLSKSAQYYYDAEAIREPLAESTLADGRNATGRHTQGKNGSKYFDEESPDTAGADKPSWYRAKTFVNPETGRNKRSVWTIPTSPYKEAHFATFPPKLIEPMILAGCPEDGTLLDPFAGSGTVGQVGIKHQRNAILIDLNPVYVTLQEKRTDGVQVAMPIGVV